MPINQINIRTEEIDEILGKTPNSIIRWGVTVILLVVLVLLVGSWFFKYPDKISGEIEISTQTPPAVVVAKATGKIDSLYVSNGQHVHRDDLLAVIDNPARINDVYRMKVISDSLISCFEKDTSLYNISVYVSGKKLKLGELQTHFTNFIAAYNNLAQFYRLSYFTKKIGSVNKQISDYELYYNYSYDKKRTVQADFSLAEKDYNRYRQLFNNGAIAEAELDQAKSRYLNKKSVYESVRTQLANIKIQISQLENTRTDLQLQQTKEKNRLLNDLRSAYKNLLAQQDIWEKHYLLKAPVAGKCVFTRFRTKNQNINAGDALLSVVSEQSNSIVGRMLLPVRGAGKVKTGQKVNVSLENYPYMEFGRLEGVVKRIAAIPDNKGFYYVEVQFPNGIITSYGKTIPFSQNMAGQAEIITEEIRLLYRVIQPIRSLFIENT
ncbi:MAG: hypothetical protein DRJ09_11395 [Bacteroidetes bacterium]|nr:MAG: hypothetical protein DRJ09_11395 [Bacteroidota bacterium]